MSSAAERLLVRALCRTETSGSLRGTILTALASHRFVEPEHDVLFAALTLTEISDALRDLGHGN
jgi:hypothetical protein